MAKLKDGNIVKIEGFLEDYIIYLNSKGDAVKVKKTDCIIICC